MEAQLWCNKTYNCIGTETWRIQHPLQILHTSNWQQPIFQPFNSSISHSLTCRHIHRNGIKTLGTRRRRSNIETDTYVLMEPGKSEEFVTEVSALFIKSNISVGASGALFGLLGSMLSELIINWTIYANKIAVLVTLVVIIIINLAVGLLPHVDNFAHIGGFVSGFLLGFVFLIRPQFGWVSQKYASRTYSTSAKPKFKMYQMVLWVVSLILLIIGFTSGLVMLFRGVDLNDHCSWCHYMSCLPTSRWSCNTEPVSCMSEQTINQLTLTCSNSNKTRTYPLSNPSTSKIQGLCTQLCR